MTVQKQWAGRLELMRQNESYRHLKEIKGEK